MLTSEPTTDGEPETAVTREPVLKPMTEPIVTPEPEPQECSGQVCEPATQSVSKGVLVAIEGLEGSPTHTPAAEGKLQLATGIYIEELIDILDMDLIDWFGEVIMSVPESPVSPLVPSSSESPASLLVPTRSSAPVFPPSLPLPLPGLPVSSSA